jgi:hypothetical protein
VNVHAGSFADKFVVGTFVRILEAAPSADVIDQDAIEIGSCGLNVGNQLLQSAAANDGNPAATIVRVSTNDLDVSLYRIGGYYLLLISR